MILSIALFQVHTVTAFKGLFPRNQQHKASRTMGLASISSLALTLDGPGDCLATALSNLASPPLSLPLNCALDLVFSFPLEWSLSLSLSYVVCLSESKSNQHTICRCRTSPTVTLKQLCPSQAMSLASRWWLFGLGFAHSVLV